MLNVKKKNADIQDSYGARGTSFLFHNIMDWKELFGSDDDGESDSELTEKQKLLIENENNIVQPTITFDKIPGLKLVQQALNHEQQMYLVNALIDHEYFTDERNQIMLFGELPLEIKWLIPWVKKNYSNLFEPDVFEREPLFDQAILNMYKKGDGILSHVDLLRSVWKTLVYLSS